MMEKLLEIQKALGCPIYLVGGMVRDKLLGKEPKDYDLTCPLPPQEMLVRLDISGFRIIPTGIKHGTLTVVLKEGLVEITSHRSDGSYEDGRRPEEVHFGVSLEEDLARRDFTINAMALTLDGQLIDPFDGQGDLKRKLIRAVGNPLDRFNEDGLRPMRACRFVSQLDFDLDPHTAQAILPTLPKFNLVARERIQIEFEKLIHGINPVRALQLMRSSGLLASWIPETLWTNLCIRKVALANSPLAKLATFFKTYAKAEDILLRLKFPLKTIEQVRCLNESEGVLLSSASDTYYHLRRIATHMEEHGLTMEDWLALPNHEVMRSQVKVVFRLPVPLHIRDLVIDGKDLMELAQKPQGKWMADTLKYLQDQVHRDPRNNTKEKLSQLVVTYLENCG